jgi:hypothetical protein
LQLVLDQVEVKPWRLRESKRPVHRAYRLGENPFLGPGVIVVFTPPLSTRHTNSATMESRQLRIHRMDPTRTTHHSGFRRACVRLVNSTWIRRRDSPREERHNYG